MRASLALCFCLATPWLPAAQEPVSSAAQIAESLDFAVDARVELFSLVFRLAGNPEYDRSEFQPYVEALESAFGSFRDHPAVREARRLRQARSVSYDAVMSLAVHVDDVAHLRPRRPLAESNLESRWRPEEAGAFLALLRQFVADTEFEGFWAAQEERRELTLARLRQRVESDFDMAWYADFFGEMPRGQFHVFVGMGNGPSNYGTTYLHADGREDRYAILGLWKLDESQQPVFGRGVISTLVHEFNHSFINPLVYAHVDELRPAGEALFPLVEAAMRRQAYGNWKTMLHESLVRAAVVRYLRAHDGDSAAYHEAARQDQLGFRWMAELVALLGEYERKRDAYPTFSAFFPEVVAFFSTLPPWIEQRLEQEEAARPRLVSSAPENGAADVSPDLKRIVFTFDRRMRRDSYSVMLGPEGNSAFPTLGQVGFDEAGLVFTMEVELEPGRRYHFTLNSETGGSFRSRAGGVLAMVDYSFTTSAEAAGEEEQGK